MQTKTKRNTFASQRNVYEKIASLAKGSRLSEHLFIRLRSCLAIWEIFKKNKKTQMRKIVLSRNAKQCRKELARGLCINESRRGCRRILTAFAVGDCGGRNFSEVRCKVPFLGNPPVGCNGRKSGLKSESISVRHVSSLPIRARLGRYVLICSFVCF